MTVKKIAAISSLLVLGVVTGFVFATVRVAMSVCADVKRAAAANMKPAAVPKRVLAGAKAGAAKESAPAGRMLDARAAAPARPASRGRRHGEGDDSRGNPDMEEVKRACNVLESMFGNVMEETKAKAEDLLQEYDAKARDIVSRMDPSLFIVERKGWDGELLRVDMLKDVLASCDKIDAASDDNDEGVKMSERMWRDIRLSLVRGNVLRRIAQRLAGEGGDVEAALSEVSDLVAAAEPPNAEEEYERKKARERAGKKENAR